MHLSESEKANTLKEVRLMARFNWPGIVRYNNSWIEEPPKGWQVLFIVSANV